MFKLQLLTLVTLIIVSRSSASIDNNKIDNEPNPLAEAAAAILKEQGAENIGAMVNNLVQGGGLKNLLNNENAGQLLQGLNSVLGGQEGGAPGAGFDPSVLGAAMSMFQQGGSGGGEEGGFDPASLLSLLGGLMGDGRQGSLMDYLPMLMQTIGAFTGPEAHERAAGHSDHAGLIPPVVERLHVAFDHFIHSDMGKGFVQNLGAEKFMKIFEDENGNYNYDKFVEMMENHSFRKHWIRMVTDRIALTISHFADPKMQKQYLQTVQQLLNGFLRGQGFPKSTFFDYNKPVETITSLANYVAKTIFQVQFSSKQYVKPAVAYVQELFRMVEKQGILNKAIDTRELSNKLADTINMEAIEPLARVNRAYRFAKKQPKCDKYVMCLVNQDVEGADEQLSLPGLKTALSRSLSVALSWYLSSTTQTSFWTLYGLITDKNDCQIYYKDECNDFHVEEIRTTTEYVHNEL